MRLFDRLFKKRKKNRDYDEEAAQARYAKLDDGRRTGGPYDVVELCEQMVDVSRELENTRSEYQTVTNYLNDIQTIENLDAERKAPLVECATHMVQLEQSRSEYLKTERLLSDTQFAQFQSAEDELPKVIKRLQSNETYLETIKKDMSYLEGEKLQWSLQKSDSRSQMNRMRKLSVYLFVIYATLAALFVILGIILEQSTKLPMLISTAFAAILGVVILVRYQDAARDIHQAEVNRNRAITLENHVKIKYVNIKNAVDYTCEKYHAKNSRDLVRLFELYQKERRERERFRQNNDELDLYTKELVFALQDEHLYDAKVWSGHANAIVDPREMVELKHELLSRRQKLRASIEYNINTLSDMKKEILQSIHQMGDRGPQVEQILHRLEEISASL